MGCHFETGYTLASGERDWRHARMLLPGVSGTVAASTTAAGYYDDAPDGQETYTRWKPSAVPATWDITPAGSVSCNAAFIGAHDLGTQGATVTVQYQATDGGAWTDIMSVTPGDDAPLFLFFTAKDGFGWRVSLTGAVAEIGRIIFGTTIVMPQPIYGGVKPIDLTREVERKASVSQGGEILGLSVRNVMLGGELSWQHVTPTEYREEIDPFIVASRTEAFGLAWNPARDPNGVAYATMMREPQPQTMGVLSYGEFGFQFMAHGGWEATDVLIPRSATDPNTEEPDVAGGSGGSGSGGSGSGGEGGGEVSWGTEVDYSAPGGSFGTSSSGFATKGNRFVVARDCRITKVRFRASFSNAGEVIVAKLSGGEVDATITEMAKESFASFTQGPIADVEITLSTPFEVEAGNILFIAHSRTNGAPTSISYTYLMSAADYVEDDYVKALTGGVRVQDNDMQVGDGLTDLNPLNWYVTFSYEPKVVS